MLRTCLKIFDYLKILSEIPNYKNLTEKFQILRRNCLESRKISKSFLDTFWGTWDSVLSYPWTAKYNQKLQPHSRTQSENPNCLKLSDDLKKLLEILGNFFYITWKLQTVCVYERGHTLWGCDQLCLYMAELNFKYFRRYLEIVFWKIFLIPDNFSKLLSF